jgi:hypothetical protein
MKIKLSVSGFASGNLSQFTGNVEQTIEGCQFLFDDNVKQADAWFVVEDVKKEGERCFVPAEQVHFLGAETSWPQSHFLRPQGAAFLSQFARVHSSFPNAHPAASSAPPFLPWMVNAGHTTIFEPHSRDLNFLTKLRHTPNTKPLSVFCSSKTFTEDHRLRFEFVKHLKSELGDDLDWFGIGVREIPEKWDGLASYERTIVLENRSDRGVFSEKILDPFLSLTQPIYWGAPDIGQFLPVDESHQIDIRDFRGAVRQIQQILKHPITAGDAEVLLQGKSRVLSELHFLRRIARLAKATQISGGSSKQQLISIRNSSKFLDRSPRATLGRTYSRITRMFPG